MMILQGTDKPTHPLHTMTTFEIAQALGQHKGQHAVTCSEHGYFFENGKRISKDRAIEVLQSLAQPATRFETLNAATQAFFYRLGEQIVTATQDASASLAVKLGRDLPRLSLYDAPRLTWLKRVGLVQHAGKGVIQLTELGQSYWASYSGI